MEKKSKYDTNPLPEDVLRDAEEAFGPGETNNLSNGAQTRSFTPQPQKKTNADSEAPTRNFQERYDEPYNSVFNTQFQHEAPDMRQPVTRGPERQARAEKYKVENLPLTSRQVSGLNLPENIVMIAPYLPFTLGGIAALIFLLLTPRHETRVRFHASQGLALHIATFAISSLLSIIGSIAHVNTGAFFFGLASTIFFVISMIRVWKGEPHHISQIDDATNWLNEKIDPRR